MPDSPKPEATEMVLGVPRDRIPGGLNWRGLRGGAVDQYLDLVAREGTYRPRPEAEDDSSWKQIIPYLCLFDGECIFLMRRTRGGADARLHDRYSIGIGGHVNPQDTEPIRGLWREWTEELVADFAPEFEPLGVLNDDSNPVGAVHLGLVFTANAGGRPVAIRETTKLSGGFVTLDEVAAIAPGLETWSNLLFDFLLQKGARTGQVR